MLETMILPMISLPTLSYLAQIHNIFFRYLLVCLEGEKTISTEQLQVIQTTILLQVSYGNISE